MSTLPIYELELRATDDRKRLESSLIELKSRVRENLDIKTNVRQHVWIVGGIVAVIGLLSGYAVTGLFTRH